MKGFKNKPAVLPAAEPSAAKSGGAPRPDTCAEADMKVGHKKKRDESGLPAWLHIKSQDRWPLVRLALVVVLCISAGWYFVDFYGGKDAQAEQALPSGAGTASVSASRAGARGTVSPAPTGTLSASVKWTPTAQEAKKRDEALKMPLPAKPEEITQNTDEGAVATAKYAIELYNYAFATGNVDEYKSLCVSDRKSCVKVPVDTVKIHQNGGWVDPIQVTFVSGWVRKDVTKNVVVQLWFYRNAGREYSGKGASQDIPAGKFASLVTLKFDGTEWKVQEIYVEEK